MKAIRLTCLAVIVIALMFGLGPRVEAQPPIRIGASLAQTGVYAVPGQNQLRGYRLCVKHVNDKGGVLGRKLELVVYDDGSDPATAADDLAGPGIRQRTIELTKKRGLQVVFADAYPPGTTDFSAILTRVRAANPDVLGVATSVLEDGVAITHQ